MNTDTPRLIIVRHGETDGNSNRIVQVPETPLNGNGKEQAKLLAKRLSSEIAEPFSLLSSDYSRALETATPTAAATGVEIDVDPLLRERNFGDLRGRRYDDLGLDPFAEEYRPPNGESWSSFYERVDQLWASITERFHAHQQTLVAVTHGLVCRALVERHCDLGGLESKPWGNTAVSLLEPRVEPGARFLVTLLACQEHLEPPGQRASSSGPQMISGI